VVDLATAYIAEKVIGQTSYADCLHIALATINRADFLVSWNFKHIVNIERISGYNSINIKNGYKQLEIRSPREFEKYEDDWKNIWRCKLYASTKRQIEWEVSQNDKGRDFGILQETPVTDDNKALCIAGPKIIWGGKKAIKGRYYMAIFVTGGQERATKSLWRHPSIRMQSVPLKKKPKPLHWPHETS
jgi:hypothetical protein